MKCYLFCLSHLSALRNHHIASRLALPSHSRILDLMNYIHPLHHLPKHDMLVIQEGRLDRGNEELRAIAVLARIGHTQ